VRILADENFPGTAVAALRQRGHDVLWVRTDHPGASDHTVLRRAQDEKRLVLTFDKDFGELAFRFRLPASCGVLLFRIRMRSPDIVARAVVSLLEGRADWAGYFSVVEDTRVRMTPLPAPSDTSHGGT